jgi:perosamine synthetase
MIPVNRPLIETDDIESVTKALQETLISGETPPVREMERLLSLKTNSSQAVAVSSGTSAIDLVTEALEIKPGDHCVVPDFTIISTVSNLLRKGARVEFIDSDPETWSIDSSAAVAAINQETKLVLPVHIYGLPADMDPILASAAQHGTFVLEDSAEALGLDYKQRPCGSLGDASIFSFYANKVVTGGEGGAITTNNAVLAERLRKLRNLAFSDERFVHHELGWNYRISGLSAALIASQLARLDELILKKKGIANRYRVGLKDHPWFDLMIENTTYAENVYWVVPILLRNDSPFTAKSLQKSLKEIGIETRRFFCPMHLQPLVDNYNVVLNGDYKISENLWERGLYLPSGLGNSTAEIDEVITKIWDLVK